MDTAITLALAKNLLEQLEKRQQDTVLSSAAWQYPIDGLKDVISDIQGILTREEEYLGSGEASIDARDAALIQARAA